MLKYRREFKFRRVHKSILGAVALLLVFSFLLQNVAGSAYYSLLMQPDTTVTSPPVELQEGTAVNSTSTIYTNKTSALVSVELSGTGGTDVEDYVDNNTSDVDSSADKGTHGNFTAQQYGPDLINDTLTEEDTGSVSNEAMIVYGERTVTTPRYRLWNGTDLGSEQSAPTMSSENYNWVVLKSAPTRDEKMLVVGDSGGNAYASVWNGSSWGTVKSLGALSYASVRGFDVAYEQTSGDAMIVVDSVFDIKYWIWNGSSWVVDGTVYDLTVTSGSVGWIKLASKPNSDEIALTWDDNTNYDVGGAIWNGSAWGNQQLLEDTSITTELYIREYMAVGYEQSSGYAMFVWGADNSPTTNDAAVEWRQWNGTGWENEGTPITIGLDTFPPFYLSLKPRPNSDEMMLVVVDDALDLNTVLWGGGSWDSPVELDATIETDQNRPADFEWETVTGHSGHGVLAWSSGKDPLQTRHWDGTNWNTQFETDPYAALTDQQIHQLRRTSDDKIFLGMVDDLADLHVWRWVESGTDPYGSWTYSGNGLGEIETAMSSLTSYEAFMFSGDLHPDISYELDLEVQWTSADYDEPYEVLGIYGGTMGAENIRVDVWYNSAWQDVFTDLSSGWNNVSVGSYLDSSNFTIRFKGGTETASDKTQDTWDIDAVLLHVWASEVLGSATTVTTDATSRAVSYGKDRAVLRTTDANNTLHVFQIDSNDNLQWWKSTDNGATWNKAFNSTLSVVSFSVKKDSSNYIHIVYASGTGSVYYRKQLYNATSWGGSVTISSDGESYQPDVAIAPYNNSWVYVVYDDHAGAPVHNEVWVKNSTNGGSSFDGPVELTYNEFSYTGTFPSIVIDNTLGTYGHIYVTWYRGSTYLYLRRGNITSTGTVNWDGDSNVQTVSSGMSTSVTENTNMMHSAMYTNGKYRVVYVESGTAKYRDWDESSWSSPISLATVSHYPSITYDWDNYIYVFYHTDDSNANYDIRYQKSADTTPTSFFSARNVTANNNGNKYVSAKLGGDNNRVEFAWTYGTDPYQVKYNYLTEGDPGQGDFNYVLKFVEKDNSSWKVRLSAYDQSNIGRLDNLSIYIYDGSNSTQIVILNGLYNQQNGSWYDLNALDTEYIWMHVETSSAGTSYVYAYLEILVPVTTTYAQYIITFKIT